MFARQITVRFGECDGLGHVNNGTYFTYFEDARIDIFRLFNPSLALSTWNLIVASAKADFLEQVTYAEQLDVLTWIGRIGHSSFSVEQGIRKQDGKWAARGQAVLIAYDYEQQRPMALWEDIKHTLSQHLTAPQGCPDLRS